MGAPPPFSRPSSRRRDFSVVSIDSPLESMPPLVMLAEIDAFASAGSRSLMPPFVHSSFAPPSPTREQLHVHAAVGRARVDRAGDVAGDDAAVGRLGDDASGEASDFDAAVDRRELDLGSDRDPHRVLDLRVAHLEPAAAPGQLGLDG